MKNVILNNFRPYYNYLLEENQSRLDVKPELTHSLWRSKFFPSRVGDTEKGSKSDRIVFPESVPFFVVAVFSVFLFYYIIIIWRGQSCVPQK